VLDRTGNKGQYNIALQFAPLLVGAPADDNLPDIFAALHQLGLKLEAIKPVALMMSVTGRHSSPRPHKIRRRFGFPEHFKGWNDLLLVVFKECHSWI
jgi:hypothetical protein